MANAKNERKKRLSKIIAQTIIANNITFNCEPGDYLSGPELEEEKAA